MIKTYILENSESLAQITFSLITIGLFGFNTVYALCMKKEKAQEIALTAIELDD